MNNEILWTACITPFNQDSSKIDYESLRRLLEKQAAVGNGVVMLGSTGEALSLSDEERKEVITFACSIDLPLKLIAGVPSHNLKAALSWLEFCNDLPLAGYMLTTPIYTKPGIIGQTEWFDALLAKANKPCMLYNIPGRAAIKLHPETVANLHGYKNFVAIKDSSGTIDSVFEYKSANSGVKIYCGDDYIMPAMIAVGAEGLVSVASNIWPEITRKYVKDALEKKIISKVWWQATKSLFKASNPIPIKALMHAAGLIQSPTVRLPLSNNDLSNLTELLDYHEVITQL
jgi:4-hydroxy-tetrahydrodipicolinate synthase